MKGSVLLAAALALLSVSHAPSTLAASDNGIRVTVKGLRNDGGLVKCALYNGPDGFPRDESKIFRRAQGVKHNHVGVCDFAGVPAGTYAVSVLDDENLDSKMDFNMLHIPQKGYGFSNDAKATLSPPSFSAASFNYDGTGSLPVPIDIVYW
jgi:uncharacterized protein (DUF2141 family)